MKPKERERLLREILPGDEVSAFRQKSLELGLSALKARQKRRQFFRASTVAALALVLAGGFLWQWAHAPSTRRRFVPLELASAPLPSKASAVKFISDDELLSLFPNRAVALIGKPGHQQLLFLDEEKKAEGYE